MTNRNTEDEATSVSGRENNLREMEPELGFSNLTLAHSGMEEVVDQMLPVAPDGGYGWVIVLAAFMSNLIVDGICNAFGELKGAFKQEFQSNDATTALIGSVLIGAYLLVGPMVGGMVNKYGARKTVILGSAISGAGFFLSTFATNFVVFLILYGIVGGIGFGMIYLPAIVIVGFYFESKRAVATGIAVAGSGVGTILMPMLSEYIMTEYGWRATLYVISALIFSCALYGLLYRPLGTDSMNDKDVEMNLLKNEDKALEGKGDGSPQSPVKPGSTDGRISRNGSTGQRKLTLTSLPMGTTSVTNLNSSRCNLDGGSMSRISAKSFAQSMNLLNQVQGSNLSIALSGVDPQEFSRPLNRTDVFYSGSIRNLKEFKQEGSNMQQYRSSVLSIPRSTIAAASSMKNLGSGDLHDATARLGGSQISRLTGLCDETYYDDGKCKCLPLSVRNAFNEMIDIELLKDPVMLLLCLSNLLGMMGFYIPIVFLKDLATSVNVDPSYSKYLVPIFGVTNTVGRVVFGWVADRGYVSALNINNFSLVTCGLLTIVCPMLTTFEMLMAYSAVFGFIISAYISLTSIVLADLLGLDKLTNSFGLLVVARGIASLAGSPFAGMVYEVTNSYPAAFVFAGVLIIVSGIISCLVPCAHSWKQKKNGVSGSKKKDDEELSGKLSVVSEKSEENLTEYQRTLQSLRQQEDILQEMEKEKNGQIKLLEKNGDNIEKHDSNDQ